MKIKKAHCLFEQSGTLSTDACNYADYINIRVNRLPEADKLYKDEGEINWYDEETRLFLVKELGWACFETSFECITCKAKEFCRWWEE